MLKCGDRPQNFVLLVAGVGHAGGDGNARISGLGATVFETGGGVVAGTSGATAGDLGGGAHGGKRSAPAGSLGRGRRRLAEPGIRHARVVHED